MDLSDEQLLERYIAGCDDRAFGVLVGRHLDLVHAVARRVTGNDEMARDVAQAVFIRLAAQAACLPQGVALPAWLHRSTRTLAMNSVRTEVRRKARERLALPAMDPNSPAEPDWSALSPMVDELVDHLPAADREILVLRYYCEQSHGAIATRLGLTEAVARKRAYRAVEKLRTLLGKRGIATSSAALATLLPAHAAPAAPALLAASILQAAQGITPVAPSLFTSILITMNASQKIVFAGAVLLLLAATGYSLAPDPGAGSAAGGMSSTPQDSSPGHRGDKIDGARTRTARAVPATAAERLERLRTIMAMASSTDRHAALIAYLDELPPALFQEAADFLIAGGTDSEAIGLLASAWAKADLPSALAFADTLPRSSVGFGMEEQMIKDWELADPHAALAWAASTSVRSRYNVRWMLERLSRRVPEEMGKLLRELPPGNEKAESVRLMVVELMGRPGVAAQPEILQRILAGASESQRAVIYGQMAFWSMNHPDVGFALVKEHPEALPFADLDTVFAEWVGMDRDAALAAFAELPPGEMRDQSARGLIYSAARSQPEEALNLMDQYPGLMSETYLLGFLEILNETAPELALGQSYRIADAGDRDESIGSQLKAWLKREPAAAEAWLEEHPQPEAILKKLPAKN